MRTNLSLANIRSNLTRSAISVAGIGIAVVLIFMQLGFRGAVETTATTIYGKMDFDLLVRSDDYLHFVDCRTVPRSLVQKIESVSSVKEAIPFFVSMGNWLHPDGKRVRGVVIMGVPYGSNPFREAEVEQKIRKLTSDRFLLVDRRTHYEYGPRDQRRFGDSDIGVVTNVNHQSVEVVDHFEIGAGLTANGSIITSDRGFGRLVPINTQKNTSMILVKLSPDADSQSSADKIKRILNNRTSDSNDIRQKINSRNSEKHFQVLTRDEVMAAELTRWIDQTPLGFVFTLGVVVSFIVGSAIVFMVLSNDVTNRLPEYATLKAMGYTNFYLSSVVLKQATYFAVFAFVPSFLFSVGLYQLTSWLANVPIGMTWGRALAVFGISVVMCWVSGFGALKKLWQAEPASLF